MLLTRTTIAISAKPTQYCISSFPKSDKGEKQYRLHPSSQDKFSLFSTYLSGNASSVPIGTPSQRRTDWVGVWVCVISYFLYRYMQPEGLRQRRVIFYLLYRYMRPAAARRQRRLIT